MGVLRDNFFVILALRLLNLVSELQKAIQPGGDYASLELELSEDGQVRAFLDNLVESATQLPLK